MAPTVASPDTALGYQASIADLYPSPLNPRQHFADLDDLAANIRLHGVLVPLLVRSVPHQVGLEIVDGERRYRAAQIAGNVDQLPVVERALADDQVLEIQLLSAIQRQALTPLEEARGYRRLIDSNRAKYSAAYIADRIGRSEKYVVDRMRLAQLTPTLQQLLDDERIGVAHAELLAKLKPEDQARASDPGNLDGDKFSRRGDAGGLWAEVGRTLAFELDDEEKTRQADPYAHLKPVTVKELEAWIARHVRFDVEHFAATAPLEFGATAIAVESAAAQPGRGKKVIQITEDYRIEDDVKDPSQRVYGGQSWKRADGSEGTSRTGRFGDKPADSPTCAHSVLGVVTVGPGYGSAYQVCIARDRCQVHWKKEIKEREKAAKAKTAGPTSKAAAKDTWEEQRKREDAERDRHLAAYRAVSPELRRAIAAAVPSTVDARMFSLLWDRLVHGKAPSVTADAYLRELVLAIVDDDPSPYGAQRTFGELVSLAGRFGIKTVAFEQAYRDHQAAAKKVAAAQARKPAKSESVPPKAKAAAKTKPTKTAKTGKAAKKR